MNLDAMLIIHALATTVMAGVIWSMQLVHYPLFARVGNEGFVAYQREHMRRISWIVGPVMLIEAVSAFWLACIDRPAAIPQWAAGTGFALVCVNWISTGALQGPAHGRLLRNGPSTGLIRFLVVSNWIRTLAWSIRAPLAMFMVVWSAEA